MSVLLVRARLVVREGALDPGYARRAARAKLRGTGTGRVAHVADMQPRFIGMNSLLRRSPLLLLTFSTLSACGAAIGVGALAACGSSNTVASGAPAATSQPGADGGGALDGAAEGGASGNVDGPGVEGTTCSFNRECHLGLRCECSESAGCACKSGARGTGKNGIDPCASGNECTSSVCVDGPPDAGSFCSDECMTAAQCTGMLPLCSDIAFVGRICIRTAPQ
jgi:hypothetical protein